MKKALIISYYFPPVNIIASRRYGDMAPYMPEFGWEPIVVTTHSEGDLPVSLPKQNIIRIGENCDSGKKVLSEERYRGVPTVLKPLYFLYRKYQFEIKSLDRFILSWGKAVLADKRVKEIKPDVIIGTYLPAVDIWVARRLSRALRVPWIADFRDASSLYNASPSTIARWVDSRIDKWMIKRACAIITISPHLAKLMEGFYKKPTHLIFNGFDAPKLPMKKEQRKDGKTILYYAGRFHPHRIPAAKLVIDWLATNAIPHAIFRIRSLGPREANEEILRYAQEKGVATSVELLPVAPPETIFQEEREADILLVCEDISKMNPISHTNMTGKLFEYLPFGAPIIAITRKDSDIRLVLEDTGRGFIASSLKECIDIMERVKKGNLPQRREESISGYSRESQCKELCRILDLTHIF